MADEWPNLVWCSVDGIIDNREKDQEVQSKPTSPRRALNTKKRGKSV
jgi:hypothetical protein